MILNTPSPNLRPAEYVITRGQDTEAEREDAKRVLRSNGCRTVRFERRTRFQETNAGQIQYTSLVIHGYVAQVHGEGMEPT